MTDGSRAIVAQYGYSPYGEVTKLQVSGNADFQYAGYYAHPTSWLFFTVSRAYYPGLGRFISRDQDEGEQGSAANLYPYANNEPISHIDSSGRFAILLAPASPYIAGVACAVAAAAIGEQLGKVVVPAIHNGLEWLWNAIGQHGNGKQR